MRSVLKLALWFVSVKERRRRDLFICVSVNLWYVTVWGSRRENCDVCCNYLYGLLHSGDSNGNCDVCYI